jgi:putative endonuclease
MRPFSIYILASKSRRLYVGVTNDLERRLYEHLTDAVGFTTRYRINRLVYYEVTGSSMAAIEREKEIKGWLRAKKTALVESKNPAWDDLSASWIDRGLVQKLRDKKADPSLRSG